MTSDTINLIIYLVVVAGFAVDHTRGVKKAKDETIAIQKETIEFLESQVNYLNAKIHGLTKPPKNN